jgi:hypothetical protein
VAETAPLNVTEETSAPARQVSMNSSLHYIEAQQRQARLARESCRRHQLADVPRRERRSLRIGARLLALLHRPATGAARPAVAKP